MRKMFEVRTLLNATVNFVTSLMPCCHLMSLSFNAMTVL